MEVTSNTTLADQHRTLGQQLKVAVGKGMYRGGVAASVAQEVIAVAPGVAISIPVAPVGALAGVVVGAIQGDIKKGVITGAQVASYAIGGVEIALLGHQLATPTRYISGLIAKKGAEIIYSVDKNEEKKAKRMQEIYNRTPIKDLSIEPEVRKKPLPSYNPCALQYQFSSPEG